MGDEKSERMRARRENHHNFVRGQNTFTDNNSISNGDKGKRTLVKRSHVQCQINGKDRTFSMTSRKATDLTSPGRLRLRESAAAGERDSMRRLCVPDEGRKRVKEPCLG